MLKSLSFHRRRLAVPLAMALALSTVLPSAAGAADESLKRDAGTVQTAIVTEAATEPAIGAKPEQGGSPVDAKVSKEKAEELSRKAFSIPEDYKLQSANYQTEKLAVGSRVSWNLNYVKQVNNKQLGSIHTRIDANNGQMLSYHVYHNDPTRKPVYPPKVDRADALVLAMKFIEQIVPQYKDQLRLNEEYGIEFRPPLSGEVNYNIRYNRLVADFAYMDNYIDLQLDGEGHVARFNVNWDDTVQFADAQSIISEQEAELKFRSLAQPDKVYLLPYAKQPPVEPMLGYVLEPFVLDAATGERSAILGEAPKLNTTEPISRVKLPGKPPAAGSLTAQQAADAAVKAFPVLKGAKLVDQSYSEYQDPSSDRLTAQWQLGWEIGEEGARRSSAWASIDARTGVIRSFSTYIPEEADKDRTGLTYEQAKVKAADFVKQQLPEYAHELYIQEDRIDYYEGKKPEEIGSYSFRLQRRVNDARVEYDRVNLSIHALSGEITNYHSDFSSYSYPVSAVTIKPEQAIEAYMDFYRIELTYVLPYENSWGGQPIPIEKYNLMVAAGEIPPGTDLSGLEEGERKAKLVYRLVQRPLDEQVFLSAIDGSWRDYSTGEPTELVKPQPTDLQGHWAARELSLMVAYKALDLEDGKVQPSRIVTRGELIKMLVLSMNSGQRPYMSMAKESAGSFNDVAADSSYFVYVESAVQQNLIDRGDGSFEPDGEVDREEMAELIVRALGYNTLAKYEAMFNVPFKDAAEIENKGQAAIVAGLKIMNANSAGNFDPGRHVTRAEAAAAFFRFLQARAELQEAPLRY